MQSYVNRVISVRINYIFIKYLGVMNAPIHYYRDLDKFLSLKMTVLYLFWDNSLMKFF